MAQKDFFARGPFKYLKHTFLCFRSENSTDPCPQLLVAPVAATICPVSLGAGGDMISTSFHRDLGAMSTVDFPFCSRCS